MKKTPLDKAYLGLERAFYRVLRSLKGNIGDDYRANDDPDDDKPGMCVTFGVTHHEDGFSWHYQTGDNSFTGGAYGHATWAVVSLYRRSNCRELAREAVDQVAESLA